MRLDMGPPPDFDPTPLGCKGKIDVLFLISSYWTMLQAQDQLVAAFPVFIDMIQNQFSEFDVHLMVVDSEEKWSVKYCDEQCPDPCDGAPDYPCGAQPTICDSKMGAGAVYNVGPDTENVPCLPEGPRYITADTPDIPGTFECLARVGTSGYNMMGDALVAAMGTNINEPGGCNEGFLRDDALLMLVIIGPEDSTLGPGSSQGTWQEWRQKVVEAKHDNLSAIVVFGIVSGSGCPANDNSRLCSLVQSFPQGTLEHFDTINDYGQAFGEAAELAIDACSLYVPG